MANDLLSSLSPTGRRIFEALRSGRPISIEDLYRRARGVEAAAFATRRRKQQWLGAHISRVNIALEPHGLAVRPAPVERYNYQLVRL